MKTFIYILLMTFSFFNLNAQSQFESRVKAIKDEISAINAEEKAKLEAEVQDINRKLERNEITATAAEASKIARAEACADRVENRIIPLENELQDLIKDEIEGDDDDDFDEGVEDLKSDIKDVITSMKDKTSKNKNKKKYRNEARTTNQFVFAFGLNNVLTDGSLKSLDNNSIKAGTSRFYEWGVTWKTRLSENSSFLNIKYGLSLTYNNLRPEDNTYFVKTGNQTILEDHPKSLYNEPYFRTTNLVIPVHLELDFSKKIIRDDQKIIKTQKGFRVGFGGYAGINTRAKQILEYKEDGLRTSILTKGNYNTSTFVYGVSGYIGYKSFSLYTKYDLNPLFANNPVDQNNASLGLRFDFN